MAYTRKADRMLKEMGVRLKASRIAAAYPTAEEFAEQLGLEPHTYRKYDRGDAMPPIDVLQQICDLTAKTSDFLLFGRAPKA